MKNRILSALLLAILPAIASAQFIVVDFGPSATYVTANQNLTGGNNGFSTALISPSTGYSGPSFWGGVAGSDGFGMSTWAIMDNYGTAGDLDVIRGARSGVAVGISATYAIMFSGTQQFTIDDTSDSAMSLKARRDGGQTEAGVTGIRWLLRDTDGNYFISALNDSAAAQFSNTWANNSPVTATALSNLSWFSYTFSTAAIGAAASGLQDRTFDAAGFHYTAKRVTSTGGLDMSFGEFSVTAIPEPGAYAALLGGLGLLLVLARRRKEARS
jgi:hypothetical protein